MMGNIGCQQDVCLFNVSEEADWRMYSFGLSVFLPSSAVGKVDIFKVDPSLWSKVMTIGGCPDYTSGIRSTEFCGCNDVWKKKFSEDKVTDDVCSLRMSNIVWRTYPLQFVSLSSCAPFGRNHDAAAQVRDNYANWMTYALRKRISILGSFAPSSLAAAAAEGISPKSSLRK